VKQNKYFREVKSGSDYFIVDEEYSKRIHGGLIASGFQPLLYIEYPEIFIGN